MRGLFRVLDGSEEQEFRDWAREVHRPFDTVNPLWHPVVREECAIIDNEQVLKWADALQEDDNGEA